ncbi:TRAP transporter small permease [Chloroflexota bacterium]
MVRKSIRNLLNAFVKAENVFLIIAYIVILGVIIIEVVSRYVMRSAIFGLEEVALLTVSYAFYIGAACATRDERHITAEVLHLVHVPPRGLRFIKRLTTAWNFVAFSIFSYYIMQYVISVANSPAEYAPFHFHKVYYTAGIGVGFVLIALHALQKFIEALRSQSLKTEGLTEIPE